MGHIFMKSYFLTTYFELKDHFYGDNKKVFIQENYICQIKKFAICSSMNIITLNTPIKAYFIYKKIITHKISLFVEGKNILLGVFFIIKIL